MDRRLQSLFSRDAMRAIALLTALVVLAGAIGIPVPRLVNRDVSQPFPCMHHACGCGSAEDCWRGCCCMTHEQKLAWAKKHHVTPPAGIVEVARKSAKHGASCCQSEKCDAGPDSAGRLAMQVIRIEDHRKCQGHSSLWLVLSQALPPQVDACFESELTVVGWLRPAATAQLASPAFDPATPPPRAAL